MKPDWNEAPEWANWWAIDEGDDDGFAEWGWYENSPHLLTGLWFYSNTGGEAEYDYTVDYRNGHAYKEKRPST